MGRAIGKRLIFSIVLMMIFVAGSKIRDVKAETVTLHGWLSETKGGEAMGNARYGEKFYVCFEITGSESGTNLSDYEDYTIKYTLTKPDGTQTVSQATNKQKACWGVNDPQLGHYKMNLQLKANGLEVECNLAINCIDVEPAIKSQPISTVVSQGNKITYSIETKGTHNVYQWYKNNVKIAGATLSSYTTSTLYASDNGDYYTCSVSNTGNDTIYSEKAYCYVRGYPTTPTVELISNGKLLTDDEWARYCVYIIPQNSQINGYGSVLYQYSWDKNMWYTLDSLSYEQDTAQKELYVRAVNKEDNNLTSSMVICSFKKDATIPHIQTVYTDSKKAHSVNIYVKGITDNLSGLADISISDDRSNYKWVTNTNSEYKKTISKNGIYYIAVRDKAGNISNTYECNVNNIIKQQKQIITAPTSLTSIYKTKPFYLNAKTNGNSKLSYSIDNSKIATINGNGKITVKRYGRAKITVKASASSEYTSAQKTIILTVCPQKMKMGRVSSPKKKCIKMAWTKDKTVTGYELYLSKRKDFKKETFSRTYKSSTVSMFTSGLQSKKNYYVKIRAYKKIGKQKYYGAWSRIKSVKIK